jgi:hypothetical protein
MSDEPQKEVSNAHLAFVLGRIEGTLASQMESSLRQERSLASLEAKIELRLDGHEARIRSLELTNPAKLAESVASQDKRIRSLEEGSTKSGILTGITSAIAISVLVEFIKRKFGS